MKLNKAGFNWTATNTCNNEADVENVATHEFGHWFGLGDLDAGLDLTMYGGAPRCETKKRSLGIGDLIG
jgi:hypothetical protein